MKVFLCPSENVRLENQWWLLSAFSNHIDWTRLIIVPAEASETLWVLGWMGSYVYEGQRNGFGAINAAGVERLMLGTAGFTESHRDLAQNSQEASVPTEIHNGRLSKRLRVKKNPVSLRQPDTYGWKNLNTKSTTSWIAFANGFAKVTGRGKRKN